MSGYLEILYVGRKIMLDPYEMLPDVISVDVRTGCQELANSKVAESSQGFIIVA
jgi:hypothetical protein